MGENIRLRNGVYWFRRRVPDGLVSVLGRRELHRSLRTGSSREAATRARRAWLETEEAFRAMSDDPRMVQEKTRRFVDFILRKRAAPEPEEEDRVRRPTGYPELELAQTRMLVQQLLREPVAASALAREIIDRAADGDRVLLDQLQARIVEVGGQLDRDDYEKLCQHNAWMGDYYELKVKTARAEFEELRATYHDYERTLSEERAHGLERQVADLLAARPATEAVSAAIVEAVAAPQAVAVPPVPPTPEPSEPARKRQQAPRFSRVEDAFLSEKTRGEDGYSGQTVAQVRATFRLWLELVGDRPVSDYTGADAGEFRDLLLRLPASHGKGGRVDAKAAIAEADRKQVASGATVPRLSMKTAKRHFSAMSQVWVYLKPRGHVAANIFSGFAFAGTKSTRRQRDDWSDEDLRKLLSSAWVADGGDTARRWAPLIAMFSGMRLEEICRLRVDHDVVDDDGVVVFKIQRHPDGWSPKSEAGERVVPLHSCLVELGFLELLARRRAAGDARVFPELQPSGPDAKLSAEYSRRFGKLKDGLGVGRTTTFHSFRHSVSTILRNTETPEAWIDAVLGHEGDGKSVGAAVYLKRIGTENLRKTVEAIAYPGVEDLLVR